MAHFFLMPMMMMMMVVVMVAMVTLMFTVGETTHVWTSTVILRSSQWGRMCWCWWWWHWSWWRCVDHIVNKRRVGFTLVTRKRHALYVRLQRALRPLRHIPIQYDNNNNNNNNNKCARCHIYYLSQRLSVIIQRFNLVLIHESFFSADKEPDL